MIMLIFIEIYLRKYFQSDQHISFPGAKRNIDVGRDFVHMQVDIF